MLAGTSCSAARGLVFPDRERVLEAPIMKPVTNQDTRMIEISKYVYTAGVFAGVCYESYKQWKTAAAPAKPAQAAAAEVKQKAGAAVA
jgi:hypothetical protein